MTASTRWLFKTHTSESLDDGKSEEKISWSSSSESDDEELKISAYKKRKLTTTIKNWISVPKSQTPEKPEIISLPQLPSPILTGPRTGHLSPVLSQRTEVFTKETSPVLSRRKIIRQFKKRKNENLIIENPDDSLIPSTQPSSSTTVEIESLSPSKNGEIPDAISPIKSQISDIANIDIVLTQDSSPVSGPSHSNSTSEPSSVSNSQFVNHQQIAGPQKRKYKKNGLASSALKAINLYKSSVSFWEHEIGKQQSKNLSLEAFENQDGRDFSFGLDRIMVECNCTILGCSYVTKPVNTSILRCNRQFVIMFCADLTPKIEFKVGKCYKLLPPYKVKTMDDCFGGSVNCFYCVSKFLLL